MLEYCRLRRNKHRNFFELLPEGTDDLHSRSWLLSLLNYIQTNVSSPSEMYEIDHFTTLVCVLNITRTEKLSEISKEKYDGVSIF
jgi:hypothetical protein